MIRHIVMLTAVAGMLTGTSSAAADGSQTHSPTVPTMAAPEAAPLSKRPFGRIFTQQRPPASVPLLLRAPLPNPFPSKTCGMIVLPPDPSIDPKFERPPADTRTRYSIRTIPLTCR
jgi:hypothetical protein